MALTDRQIKNAKARDRAYKIYDERGLFVLIKQNGSKCWRFKYRYGEKEKLLALGLYGDLTLAEARAKRDRARNLLANGVDPSLVTKQEKRQRKIQAENTFESIAREWHAKSQPKWTPKHAKRIIDYLSNDVFPIFGENMISAIAAPEILAMLQRIESRGAPESARRTNQTCSQIFRYAVATGRAERDPCVDLRGALTAVKRSHYASLTDKESVGGLMRALTATKVAL